jgi:hypothetical protein
VQGGGVKIKPNGSALAKISGTVAEPKIR